MSESFLGEIRIFSFQFAPHGWAMCNGQLLPINQNQALFALLGTTYGGNGQTTFALPNLQARLPMHIGNGHVQGEAAGETSHTLTTQEMPAHSHVANANKTTSDSLSPAGKFWGTDTAGDSPYAPAPNGFHLSPTAVSTAGGSQPHNNLAPSLVLNFCIALVGIFPSRN
jgi:microcystin-dependent protein